MPNKLYALFRENIPFYHAPRTPRMYEISKILSKRRIEQYDLTFHFMMLHTHVDFQILYVLVELSSFRCVVAAGRLSVDGQTL